MSNLKLNLEDYNESFYVLWNDNNEEYPTEEEIMDFFLENCDLEEEKAFEYGIEESDYAVASHYGYDNCKVLRNK